jgi:hypothetical protein
VTLVPLKSGLKTEVQRYPLERANDELDDLRGGRLPGGGGVVRGVRASLPAAVDEFSNGFARLIH